MAPNWRGGWDRAAAAPCNDILQVAAIAAEAYGHGAWDRNPAQQLLISNRSDDADARGRARACYGRNAGHLTGTESLGSTGRGGGNNERRNRAVREVGLRCHGARGEGAAGRGRTRRGCHPLQSVWS